MNEDAAIFGAIIFFINVQPAHFYFIFTPTKGLRPKRQCFLWLQLRR